MRIFQGVTSTRVGIFLALLFGAVALLALGLQLAGVQDPRWATVCYVAAIILAISSPIALFWTQIRKFLPWIRRLSWPFALARTVERLEAENQQLRTEAKQLQEDNERQIDMVNKFLERENARKQRIRLYKALYYLHDEGVSLRNGNYSKRDCEGWEKRTSELIEVALGEERVHEFLKEDPGYAEWNRNVSPDDPEEQIRMAYLLDRLKELKGKVNSLEPLELRPGIDLGLWIGERYGFGAGEQE